MEWKFIDLFLQVDEKHKGIYGFHRIDIYLNCFLNAKVNHKCVYRLLTKLLELKAVICRKWYIYKLYKKTNFAEGIFNREFRKNYQAIEILLTNVTEFKYGQHFKVYLNAYWIMMKIKSWSLNYFNRIIIP